MLDQSFYVPVLLQLSVGIIRDILNNHERHNFRMPGNVYERGAMREKGRDTDMHCKKAALVINPRTGQNLAKITDVLAVLAAAGWKTELGIKEYGGHSMLLANEAAEGNSDLVIAYGGDGTVNQIVNGVVNSKRHSVVGVIPGGTANLWAGDTGIPKDPVEAALALVDSEPRKVDIGRVTVQELTFPEGRRVPVKGASKRLLKKERHHFLLMAGLGMDAAVMSGVSKPLKYQLGPLAVGLSAAKELPEQRPFPVEIVTTGERGKDELVWTGEASQIIVGNTRRYAIVLEMTPNAYIDDGVLDVCVITNGGAISTMQQVSSLLLRRKPDNVSSEFFRGAHIGIRVPASVPLELDGSTINLKDYLSKADYAALQDVDDLESVKVTYRFDSLPEAIAIAIPRTYSGELFEHDANVEREHSHQVDTVEEPAKYTREQEPDEQTELQEHTTHHVTQPLQRERSQKETLTQPANREAAQLVDALLDKGRRVQVVGKAPNPAEPHTYIVAGHTPKRSSRSGDTTPVAVVINQKTRLFNREGTHVSQDELMQLQQGDVLIVEGKKSKRGVIAATRLIL
jgi:YegS/Rv2252/BmrU family lipid kinase